MSTITLTARSDPGARGQQFVAVIDGRDKRKRFALTFLGRRESGHTEVEATPGLYLARDVKTSTKVRSAGEAIVSDHCMVVWMDGTTAVATEIEEAQALDLAGQMGAGKSLDWTAIGTAALLARIEARLEAFADKPDDEPVKLAGQVGSLPAGMTTHGALRAARRAEIARLRGESPALPIELDGGPSDPTFRRRALEEERAKLVARLAEIDVELAVRS